MQKKLKPKIEFSFENQDELLEFNVDMEVKTPKKTKPIKIIELKKKVIDPSTKLF
jgi:hypothetical protein